MRFIHSVYVSNKLNRSNCKHSFKENVYRVPCKYVCVRVYHHRFCQTQSKMMVYIQIHVPRKLLRLLQMKCFLLHLNVVQINNLFAYFDTWRKYKLLVWWKHRYFVYERTRALASAHVCILHTVQWILYRVTRIHQSLHYYWMRCDAGLISSWHKITSVSSKLCKRFP